MIVVFSELIHNPVLASFPAVVDQSDLMDILRVSAVTSFNIQFWKIKQLTSFSIQFWKI